MSQVDDARVYACLLSRSQVASRYLPIRALEGVIAPGRRVLAQIDGVWHPAMVVKPWDEVAVGSVVCLELVDRSEQVHVRTGLVCHQCREPIAQVENRFTHGFAFHCPGCDHRWSAEEPGVPKH